VQADLVRFHNVLVRKQSNYAAGIIGGNYGQHVQVFLGH
jgi:hypothetical protein